MLVVKMDTIMSSLHSQVKFRFYNPRYSSDQTRNGRKKKPTKCLIFCFLVGCFLQHVICEKVDITEALPAMLVPTTLSEYSVPLQRFPNQESYLTYWN